MPSIGREAYPVKFCLWFAQRGNAFCFVAGLRHTRPRGNSYQRTAANSAPHRTPPARPIRPESPDYFCLPANGRSRSLKASFRPRSRLAFIQFFTASV
jgi:hypothetical protein